MAGELARALLSKLFLPIVPVVSNLKTQGEKTQIRPLGMQDGLQRLENNLRGQALAVLRPMRKALYPHNSLSRKIVALEFPGFNHSLKAS